MKKEIKKKRSGRFFNKRGNIDIPIVILTLFVAVIILFFSSFFFDKFHDAVGITPAFNDSTTQGAMEDTQTALFNLDNTIFFLFIAFIIFLIISAYLIRTSPIFMVVMIILLIIITMFSFIISNTYQSLIEQGGEFGSFSLTNYPKTNFIFTNLPILFFIIDIFSLIAMFAKPSGGSL